MLFDAWEDALRKTCGHFYAVQHGAQRTVDGHFWPLRLCGLDVANFSCDIRSIDRTRNGIRLDDDEHLFLLVQISGVTKIEHQDRYDIISPGGLYLLDSTQTSRLQFDGNRSHCVSLHIPRAVALAEASGHMRAGKPVHEGNPLAQRLHAYVSALMRDKTNRSKDPDYLLDLARAAFACPTNTKNYGYTAMGQRSRFEFAIREMETFVTQPKLSLGWLAGRVGISTRQLERDFRAHDASFVSILREQRLKLACDILKLTIRSGRDVCIADIAFASGFRDVSNFNRAFRARLGITPREHAHAIRSR
ncbi:helix-turn-helix domain-containing protein [Agrobacterium sp. NPDC089420]|uniref:helix-turn-helix domain-containing protein n=1 Tax=Agrobacterium sp. NPDC089420 TaxID=3363918 RepID=UPI00384DCABC